MSIHPRGGRHRAGASSGWQPIGLPPDLLTEAVATSAPPRSHPSHRLRPSRALRTSARALAVTVLGMVTSFAMMSTASAGPGLVPGADGLPVSDLLSLGSPSDTSDQPSSPTSDTSPLGSAIDPSGGLLPSLPGTDDASPPEIDGDTDENAWTPGAAVSTPDGPTYYGTPSDVATPGAALPGGGNVYLADPTAQNFNGSTGGWSAYQEYSPFCHARGVTCVNWNFDHVETGGPAGAGDGFLRVNGTSLGVAPCMPNNGVARWVSPLFTYNTVDAQSWKINFDQRQTALLMGEGHSTYSIQILDDAGRVVTTAHGPEATFPLNQWKSMETGFDGSKLVYGKDYRISIMVDIVHAETALSWGNLDFDNISMTAVPGDGPTPYTVCQAGGDPAEGVAGLLSGRRQDFCPVTNQLGQGAAPLLDAANEVLTTEPMNGLLDKGSGAFAVIDLESGQFIGYALGKESIPSSDPRNLLGYVKDGTIGEAGNYLVLYVSHTVSDPAMLLDDPAGNIQSITAGQLGNLTDLLADPGRLTRIPLDWQVDNAKFMAETILNPMMSNEQRDTAIGGVVWSDEDSDGALDDGEPVVPGVDVTLTDVNDNVYGTQTTDENGRYLFSGLQPRTDPSSYFVTFDKASLPEGASFTTQHAPGTVHGTTSHPDEETGRTGRITITRYQEDLEWNAGVVGVEDAPQPGDPGDQPGEQPGDEPAVPGVPGLPELPGLPGLPGDDPLAPVTDLIGGLLPGGEERPGDEPPADEPPADEPPADEPPADEPEGTVSITVGSPTVNGEDAGNAPGPTVTEGEQITIVIPVTNSGDVPVSGLGGDTQLGELTCEPSPLAPGETTNCTLTTGAKNGLNQLQFNFTAYNANGQQMSKSCTVYYTGAPSGNGEIATTGNAKINGESFDSSSTVSLQPSDGDATFEVEVVNNGDAPITNLSASSQNGEVTCAKSALQPGETTTCTLQFAPQSGQNDVSIDFTGTDESGAESTATSTMTYSVCTCGAAAGRASQTTADSSAGSASLTGVTSLVG